VTITRRGFAGGLLILPSLARAADGRRVSVAVRGAVGDGRTVNTPAIQAVIDELAVAGGGTAVVPPGVFLTGALFLRPRVNLHLEAGAVLRCTAPDARHFPPRRTRIEGHFEPAFTPALLNADGCHGLRITGAGVLDGAGRPVWDRFWQLRRAAPVPSEFPNIGVPRARLALIERSDDVVVEGVTFRDSQFWNLHLYRCRGATVRNARFEVPDDYAQAPSSDGIDVDSCQGVTVAGCTFSVTDDCIAAKGSRGPFALADRDSPPVTDLHVRNCHFRRGHNALSCGSEATLVRGVTVENCRVTGDMVLARLKLRPDTPQRYEDVRFRDILLDADGGSIVEIVPWTQYRDLKGRPPPRSRVDGVSFTGLRGRFGRFGTIRGNPSQTRFGRVAFADVDVTLRDPALARADDVRVDFRDVRVNEAPIRF